MDIYPENKSWNTYVVVPAKVEGLDVGEDAREEDEGEGKHSVYGENERQGPKSGARKEWEGTERVERERQMKGMKETAYEGRCSSPRTVIYLGGTGSATYRRVPNLLHTWAGAPASMAGTDAPSHARAAQLMAAARSPPAAKSLLR